MTTRHYRALRTGRCLCCSARVIVGDACVCGVTYREEDWREQWDQRRVKLSEFARAIDLATPALQAMQAALIAMEAAQIVKARRLARRRFWIRRAALWINAAGIGLGAALWWPPVPVPPALAGLPLIILGCGNIVLRWLDRRPT